MNAVLEAKQRNQFQRSAKTELRENGNFPAVVYGKDVEAKSIFINEGEFFRVIKEVGRNGVISLTVDGKKQNVVLHDYQQDPIKNDIVHADFLAVDLSSEITSNVRVDLEGEAAGATEGGVVQQPLFEISVTAKVSEFPENIKVDISNLAIGDSLSVGDIRGSQPFTINHEDDEVIVSILAPRVEEEPEESDAGEPEEAKEEE
ncbi:50S ribosomal protein L25/general stress protein Ctc [Pseudobacillus badius]|uniref:50S ribosomal protein L25/general stress protein Ctc n=1 Tax=Bacillus badius TaxID=1455 RepID=UPI0007B09AEA|nr:50S ribosomal protein L25/general stress protein Ctc [Bacillus badius]KZO00963.1 50S ribosomal protein L25/general stress protein Ctc [Bacillus badius]OCS88989.1 50S ribosomal protein L25/general stress protein Ctc [Bacillus badius]OVE48515.1 50S ribosomal protein L25/general stress protein Ctc [Bacillus badius]TDW00608.1 LSU ribosomal protein L25P [Bacillus badius]